MGVKWVWHGCNLYVLPRQLPRENENGLAPVLDGVLSVDGVLPGHVDGRHMDIQWVFLPGHMDGL